MSTLVAGSVGIDDIKTPADAAKELLGGSASYAAVSSSFFCPVNLVSIVGQDFPDEHLQLFRSRGINLDGVEVADGKTFRWSGEYHENLNSRDTLDVRLNVLERYNPALNEDYRQSRVILLANAGPDSQLRVLDQCRLPVFTIADTMDLWIQIMRDQLLDLLSRIDMLVINDSEASQLTETSNLILAGERALELGPKYVILKKGEHGALLFGRNGDFFSTGAFPLRAVHDPTGAGDSFVGGIAGYLASTGKPVIATDDLVEGILRGTVMASFTCEAFGLRRLQHISQAEIDARSKSLRHYLRIG